MSQVVPTSIEIQAALSPGVFTTIQEVHMGAAPIEVQYGIQGTGPMDRVASTGTMTWALKNYTRTPGSAPSSYGLWMPGHVNCTPGWELGCEVRLAVTYGGTTYYKFRGRLAEVIPDTGEYGRRAVICTAHDWIDEAASSFIKNTSIQTNKRADQLITTIIAEAGIQPVSTSLDTGVSTFAYALDNIEDERTSLLACINQAVQSEVGYFYVKGDTTAGGVAKMESRHARALTASSGTFDRTMYSLDPIRSRQKIVNHVIVVVHPRQVDSALSVLYSLTTTETKPSLSAGETLSMTVFFRDSLGRFTRVAGNDLVTPVAGTDFIAYSNSDGTGTLLTSSLSLVFSATSNSATLTFTNNGAITAYLTTLQVRGKAVQSRYDLAVETTDAASQTAHGERDFRYDLPCQDDVAVAKAVGEFIVHVWGDPVTLPESITISGNKSAVLLTQVLAREPGDKIVISEAMSGITAGEYFINGLAIIIVSAKLLKAEWVLMPASTLDTWILEDAVASILESTTVLGFL